MSPMLPQSPELDIRALGRVFDHTASSYKYLWLQAILLELEGSGFDNEKVAMRSLIIRMVELSRTLIERHRLFFGTQDMMSRHLKRCQPRNEGDIITQIPNEVYNKLRCYVPYRALSEFVQIPSGTPDQDRNQMINEATTDSFVSDRNPPPYRVSEPFIEIEIHPLWREYLRDNFVIIRDWLSWNWLHYLQRRNPGIPAIASKLLPKEERLSLDDQRQYWRMAIRRTEGIECIYSREKIREDNFVLDHYVPWDFIGHDQLWNLVPTLAKINSSKSNSLPGEQYFDRFVRTQHAGLVAYRNYHGAKPSHWRDLIDAYTMELRISPSSATLEDLHKGYRAVVEPLLIMAKHRGFRSDWIWTPGRTAA